MSEVEEFDYKKADEDLRQRLEEVKEKCGEVEGKYQLHCEKNVIDKVESSKLLSDKLASAQEEAEKKCASALSGIVINTVQ